MGEKFKEMGTSEKFLLLPIHFSNQINVLIITRIPSPHFFCDQPTRFLSLQVNWVMFVQESVEDSVVARLKNRMEGLKCVALPSDQDRAKVEAAVLEAEQQGATVGFKKAAKIDLCAG